MCVQEPSEFTGSEVRIRDPDSSVVNFSVAFRGAGYADADSIPLMVMQVCISPFSLGTHSHDLSHGILFHCLPSSSRPCR